MPELPEVEVIRLSLEPLVLGRRVAEVEVRCASLRREIAGDFAAKLSGRSVTAIRRRSKYLLFDLDDGYCWIVHFGMSGSLVHVANGRRGVGRHDHVIVTLSDGSRLVFNDPRRFGLMLLEREERCVLLEGLGPEPLDETTFTGAYLASFRGRTRRTVKDVLMDQRVVAGLGNIYVNEILFVSGIRPRRRLSGLSLAQCRRITEACRRIVTEAIEHKGSTVSDFLDGMGRRGGYQWRHRVYSRAGEPCSGCGEIIKAVVIGQRSSFYCPCCQK